MTTPYTWTSLETSIAAALVEGSSPWTSLSPDFVQLFPNATSYAEARISRDLVLLNTRGQQTGTISGATFALSSLAAPSGLSLPVVVLEGVALSGADSTPYHYDEASLDTVNLIWPNPTMTLAPSAADWIGRYWAMRNDLTIVVVPTVDTSYTLTGTGLFVQTPMSNAVQTTYIGNVYGDLMFCAVMIFMLGALRRNFGAQADEPRSAQSWEAQYQALLPGAKAEEARRRGLLPDIETPQAAKG